MSAAIVSIEEVERCCIASLWLSRADVFSAVGLGLDPSCFSNALHAQIFASVVAAAQDAACAEMPFEVIYGQAAAGLNEFKPADLTSLAAAESTSAFMVSFVERVIAESKKRRLLAHLTNAAAQLTATAATEWDELWSSVGPDLTAISQIQAKRPTASFADHVDRYIEAQSHPENVKTLSFGMPSWDRNAGPVRAHELVTLAARPGAGKTALALQIAAHVGFKLKKQVVFFSLEMPANELMDRLVKNRLGMEAAGEDLKAAQRRIREASEIRGEKTFTIYEDESISIDDIEARSRLVAMSPGGLGLVVIDYLQLMAVSASMRKQPREQQVADMSRRLKLLTRAIQAPVLMLAQLNREAEKNERDPRLSDLRESGAIEQDSDRVWFLYQTPDQLIKQVSADSSVVEVTLLQAKCRGGRPGVIQSLTFQRPCFRMYPVFSHSA